MNRRSCLFLLWFFMVLTSLAAMPEPDPARVRAKACHEIAAKIGAPVEANSESLQHCVEHIRSLVLSDPGAFIFNLSASWQDGRVVLGGESERPEFVDLASGVFRNLGFTSVVSQVEIVPDLTRDPTPFAVVTKPSLQMWSLPSLKGAPMDEALFGEPVYLFKEFPAQNGRDSIDLVKNVSGYWGYVATNGLTRISKAQFIQLLNAPKALLLADYSAGDVFIPAGCRLPIQKWGWGRYCQLLGPDGAALKIPKAICQQSRRAQDIAEAMTRARSLLGRPYQLGGRNSARGIDCSGLVQFAYRTLGINLARDAKQQYLNGDLILPCVAEALQPGDALFFMNTAGVVNHTALYLGDKKFIQAQGDQVKIQSMDPAAPDFFERFNHGFIGAKRYAW